MGRNEADSIQNRFTAYLVEAVANRRIWYKKQKSRRQGNECIETDMKRKNHVDFEAQYHAYLAEQLFLYYSGNWESERYMLEISNMKMIKCIERLSSRERKILFARVFGELTFTELGEKFGMKPKQAEMAYYYVIRKLRKELEVNRKHEF